MPAWHRASSVLPKVPGSAGVVLLASVSAGDRHSPGSGRTIFAAQQLQAAAFQCIFDDCYYSHLHSRAEGQELIFPLQSWGPSGRELPPLVPIPSSPGDTAGQSPQPLPSRDVDLRHLCVTNPRCEQLVNGPDPFLPPNQCKFRRNHRDMGVDTLTPLSKAGLGPTGSRGRAQGRDLDTHHPENTRQPSPPWDEQDISACLHKASESLKASSSPPPALGSCIPPNRGPFSSSDGACGSPKPRSNKSILLQALHRPSRENLRCLLLHADTSLL